MMPNPQRTEQRIFMAFDGICYWVYPDGSHRCVTQADCELINEALRQPIPDDCGGYSASLFNALHFGVTDES